MGSQVLEAISVQKGDLTTNPGGITPDVSRPITQTSLKLNTQSEPIEQRLTVRTRPDGHNNPTGSYSKPIRQLGDLVFAAGFPDPENDHAIQQHLLVTANHPNSTHDTKPETPVQQLGFEDDGQPLEQFGITTAGSTLSRPIQQEPEISNSFQITQFDFLELVFPPCLSVKNAVNTNILWRIRDFGSPLDADTLIFKVQGVEVQDSPTFVISSIPNGLQLFYDPPSNFLYDSTVVVELTIDDTAEPENTFFIHCEWQTVPDVRPPFYRNILPSCGSSGASVVAPVSFDVLDFGEGVDPDSIRLSVEGITVCSGVTLDAITIQDFATVSGVPIGATATGYHVTYTHPDAPWNYDSNVTLSMEARDLSELQNRSLFVCAFDVEESNEPIYINMEPGPCDSFVDNRTGLSFEVYGVEHGVDISTLEVRVDNKLRKVFVRPRILRTT